MTSRSRLATTSRSGKSRATARGNLSWIEASAATKPTTAKVLQFPLNDDESTSAGKFNLDAGRALLTKLENEFSERSARKGTLDAFDFYLAQDARLLRESVGAGSGKNSALNLISSRLGTLSWQVTKADMSASGDLGYTYGVFEFKSGSATPEHGSYVRVWKKARTANGKS